MRKDRTWMRRWRAAAALLMLALVLLVTLTAVPAAAKQAAGSGRPTAVRTADRSDRAPDSRVPRPALPADGMAVLLAGIVVLAVLRPGPVAYWDTWHRRRW
jgi:di/tricarboxylate transporter